MAHQDLLSNDHFAAVDLAVLSDGTILCLCEAEIVSRMGDDRYIRMARFDLEWLIQSPNK